MFYSSGMYVLVVKLLCDLCSVTTYIGIIIINNNNNNNFKFRPFLLRYTISIQWLPVVHGLHSLSCIAKINTRDLSAMKDTLRKDRDPTFNKIIKFSNSITYFRNRAMLYVFCNLFIYHLPPSVILSVNEDSFWNLSWSGKVPFLHFNTFLLSRHAFVKNGMQCSKLQSLSHRILNFVLRNNEQIAFSHRSRNATKESDYIVYR